MECATLTIEYQKIIDLNEKMSCKENNKRTVAIIQARMGSSRLPGKMLKMISGKSILEHVVIRLSATSTLGDVVVATTKKKEDDAIVDYCNKNNVNCFRGSENDVLDRFYQCALAYNATVVVRITGDCPLLEPELVDQCVTTLQERKVDYVSTAYPEASFPDGLDVEVFTFDALKRAWKEASLVSEREHVTPYIWKPNTDIFLTKNISSDKDLSKKRWTLDDSKDMQFIREVYQNLYNPGRIFIMKDILQLLEKHPEIELLNAGTIRNEGYRKSLNDDQGME